MCPRRGCTRTSCCTPAGWAHTGRSVRAGPFTPGDLSDAGGSAQITDAAPGTATTPHQPRRSLPLDETSANKVTCATSGALGPLAAAPAAVRTCCLCTCDGRRESVSLLGVSVRVLVSTCDATHPMDASRCAGCYDDNVTVSWKQVGSVPLKECQTVSLAPGEWRYNSAFHEHDLLRAHP